MSYQDEDSLVDHLDGLGTGISLFLVGLVVTIGDISIGAIAGVPMMLLGVIVPILMTRNAMEESKRAEARRRPERNHSDGYTISSKKR